MKRKAIGRQRGNKRTRLCGFLALSLVLHLLLLFARLPGGDTPPLEDAEPSLRKFVKRLPSAQRPLARRVLPAPVQRPLARKPAALSAPHAAVGPAPLATRRQALRGMPIPLVAAPLPVELPPTPLIARPVSRIGPEFQPGAVSGARSGIEEIDLGLELLGVEALDTGQHRAVVVVDPRDRRGIEGFLYLSGVYSSSLDAT